MKRILLLLLITGLPLAAQAQDFYRSNSLAMELEKLDKPLREDFEGEETWILEKRTEHGSIECILYLGGEETDRYLRNFGIGGNLEYYSHRRGDRMVEEIFYRRDGAISEEKYYYSDGTLEAARTYSYDSRGNLLGVERMEGTGETSLDYGLREDGSLRSVSGYREGDLQSRNSRSAFGGALHMEEDISGDIRDVSYYGEEGRLVRKVRYVKGEVQFIEENEYRSDGTLSGVLISALSEGTETFRTMDSDGNPLKDETFRDGRLIMGLYYSYRNGRLYRLDTRAPGIREKQLFIYEGDFLKAEEFYVQGTLERVKKYSAADGNLYTVELYDRGEVFLVIHYSDDVKVREDHMSGGKVIRTKELRGE